MLPPKKRQPGEYICKLGQQRHQSAILRYAAAGGVFVGTLFLFSIFSNSSVRIVLFLGGLTTSYYLYCNGQYLMKRAGDAKNGAKAETQVAALLLPLQRQGWQVEYNLRIRKWGDADVVLYSPKGNWFVIDVKSHSGTKVYESGRMRKCYGRNTYDFQEGDLIGKVKGQASEVKSLKNARWVTGMLCFTRGDVKIPGNNADGVYVVTANDLVNTLLQLDSSL
jgi:hypothetical protein